MSSGINLGDYMTRQEVQKELGCSTMTFWRIVDRAGRDDVTVTVLGRVLVPKSKLAVLKKHFYPLGSDARAKISKKYGAMGGHTKAANARAAERKDTK